MIRPVLPPPSVNLLKSFSLGYWKAEGFFRTTEVAEDSVKACEKLCERVGIDMDSITSIREV